ncbi:MAG: helix-turn-helix domain-containing protein [Pseudomonadota bacterium]
MANDHWTEAGEALTALILDVFKLNGRLLVAGDRLVAELGLTSARWQVLGAIAYADRPESVAWHARTMGVHRQGIQRIVNELEKEGIVEFESNPHHKRAHLVVLTSKGRKLFDAALALQIPWANDLASDLNLKDIAATRRVMEQLKSSLEQQIEFSS